MDAYHSQDIEAARRLLAENFTFTSPQDDHIDKSAASEIVAIVAADQDSVFLLYEYELRTGERYRNTEYITVRNGQLVETQVFFGGRV